MTGLQSAVGGKLISDLPNLQGKQGISTIESVGLGYRHQQLAESPFQPKPVSGQP
jgi:hypothetical protein